MKAVFRIIVFAFAVFLVISVSLLSLSSEPTVADGNLTVANLIATQQESLVEKNVNIDEVAFKDNPEVYKNDDPSSVVTVFLTIAENDSDTWDLMNDYSTAGLSENPDIADEKVEAIVQFGDDLGPQPAEFGYEDITPNAIVEIRGANSVFDPQKSYRLTLDSGSGTWREQTVINLNKHLTDETRFRNKLSFDLMKNIPHLVSLRTQFVHLYVRSGASSGSKGAFVDYGLFTQVEQPNKRFLSNHHLDRDGQLYKANNFLFNEYPDQIRLVTDPLYNENDFSQLLEIKGDRDHSKLIQMLNDINNEDIPIEQSFEKYFDRDNYFTWMAFNILSGNVESVSQNYLLYSPKNGTKWFFLAWDYDKAFPLQSNPELATKYYLPWQKGVSNYWGATLHRRVLMSDEYRNILDRKLDEMLGFLNPDTINNLISLYQPVVDKYSFAMPDAYHMPVNIDTSHTIASLFVSDIDANYELYVKSLEEPMPFWTASPIVNGDTLKFRWDASYDLGARDFTYQFVLGKDWAFDEVVYRQDTGDTTIEVPLSLLGPGKYFWRVTATNSLGGVQYSYDNYVDADSLSHPGIKVFYFTSDGEVVE